MDHSFTKRVRAYWTNIQFGDEDFNKSTPPQNADDCMDKGRSIIRYQLQAYGRPCVRSIGSSWKGDSDQPIANTNVPVLVQDEGHEQPQQLRPHEAEKLMVPNAFRMHSRGGSYRQTATDLHRQWMGHSSSSYVPQTFQNHH